MFGSCELQQVVAGCLDSRRRSLSSRLGKLTKRSSDIMSVEFPAMIFRLVGAGVCLFLVGIIDGW